MEEKTNRNIQIYRLVLYGLSQSVIARHYGIKRQAVHQIYTRYADQYGKAESLSCQLSPMPMIDKESEEMLKSEAKRLKISIAAVIRIAINQAAEYGLKTTKPKKEATLTYQIPKTTITETQRIAVEKLSKNQNKSDVIRQIIKQYILFDFSNEV